MLRLALLAVHHLARGTSHWVNRHILAFAAYKVNTKIRPGLVSFYLVVFFLDQLWVDHSLGTLEQVSNLLKVRLFSILAAFRKAGLDKYLDHFV